MKIVLAIDPEQPSRAYADALLASGARPEEVAIVQPGDALPEEFDGLVLAGGVDVDPARYGEVPVNGTVETNPARDALDFELLARAERLGAAVFGICRGLQVVNVARGGTLWQDLPSQRPGGVRHSFSRRDGHDPARPAHAVRIALPAGRKGLLLRALAAMDGGHVNSRHHQAVKELAPGLVPLASSPDGLVEAFARAEAPFLAGVQWHPENLVAREEQRALLVAFLDAARARAASRPSPETSVAAPSALPPGGPGGDGPVPAPKDHAGRAPEFA